MARRQRIKMIKKYGIILVYILGITALLVVACTKQEIISIPEQRPPVQLPDIDAEDIPEIDTGYDDEKPEEDLLDEDQ